MRFLIIIVILLFMLPAQVMAACYAYSPAIVKLSGRLERLTFAGPPNYEDVRNGDQPETGFYLSLRTAVCTTGDETSSDAHPESSVVRIQLVLDKPGYDALRPFIGKRVSIKGMLFSAHTGHHHARVLMDKISFAQ